MDGSRLQAIERPPIHHAEPLDRLSLGMYPTRTPNEELGSWYCWALPLIGLNPALRAGELRTVASYTDVDLAWKATQQKGQPMLVFVTSDHCLFCNKMKHDTYLHPAVATVLGHRSCL